MSGVKGRSGRRRLFSCSDTGDNFIEGSEFRKSGAAVGRTSGCFFGENADALGETGGSGSRIKRSGRLFDPGLGSRVKSQSLWETIAGTKGLRSESSSLHNGMDDVKGSVLLSSSSTLRRKAAGESGTCPSASWNRCTNKASRRSRKGRCGTCRSRSRGSCRSTERPSGKICTSTYLGERRGAS